MRLTDEREAEIRAALANPYSGTWSGRCRALLGEVEALRAEAVELWTCPDCAFSFDAVHVDEADGAHSCPCCGELARADERDTALARAEAAEAKLDEQIEAAIALRHDLDTLRDLYGAAEARIAAALEWLRGTHPARVSYALAALVEPVGEANDGD